MEKLNFFWSDVVTCHLSIALGKSTHDPNVNGSFHSEL
jgi:hypothetical protein